MDALQPPARRFAGGGAGGGSEQQQGPMWYPSPPHQPPPPPFPPQHQPYHHHHHQYAPHPPLPPPPPHQQQQWGGIPPPVPPPDHLQQHQPPPFHPHMPPIPPYPAPPSHYPPPLPTHPYLHHAPSPSASAFSHGYPPPPLPPPQSNQTWGNPHWQQQPGWEYPDITHHSNEEDWAARARAWAAANSATESHYTQSCFRPLGRIEGQDHVFHDQYQQAVGPSFTDIQQLSLPAQHQHLPDSIDDLHGRVNHLQESSSLNPVSCSSVTNLPTYYDARDEGLVTDAESMASLPQRSFSLSTSVNMQEVPSSSSYVSGKKEFVDQNVKLHMPLPMTSVPGGLVHSHSALPVKSNSMEQLHLRYRDQATEFSTDASDQPLDFVQRPTSDHDPHQKTSYMHADKARPMDHIVVESSFHAWTQPFASGVPLAPQGPQFDSSFIPSSSIPGHPPAVFGRVTGPNFRPSISPVTPPFGFASGPSLHPAATFPGDPSEAFNLSERPKKAPVPNWLRDEIIKKKAVIASSSVQEQPMENSPQTIRAESSDKFSRKAAMDDSKSIDSRSTEDEEDDEDEVQAAKSAAINQEIKRVLTDVLRKVTDELFEEIATKVLSEDEMEDHGALSANHKEPLPLPVSTSPRVSAKVLVAATPNTAKVGSGGRSISDSSGGNVLGLANYASDDGDEETQSSSMLSSAPIDIDRQQLEKQSPPAAVAEPLRGPLLESDISSAGCNGDLRNHDLKDDDIGDSKGSMLPDADGSSDCEKTPTVVKDLKAVKSSLESDSALQPKGYMVGKHESVDDHANNGKSKAGETAEYTNKSDSSDKLEDKRSAVKRETGMTKANWEHSGASDPMRWVDKDEMQEKMDKQRSKDRSSKQEKNVSESESRKFVSHNSSMDGGKESGKGKRDRTKEDDLRKRGRTRDEEEDRSRQRVAKDPHRQRSRQTSSPSYRGKNSRDNSLESHSSDSGGEASENSKKRKLRSSRQSLSPSPTRSRRQVSRSPHSKHSQRRHSPYSVDRRRKGRSRSRSPVHWRRPGYKR